VAKNIIAVRALDLHKSECAMDPDVPLPETCTSDRMLLASIEVGMWGTLAAFCLFLGSALVEGLTHGETVWVSYIGCAIGMATVAYMHRREMDWPTPRKTPRDVF